MTEVNKGDAVTPPASTGDNELDKLLGAEAVGGLKNDANNGESADKLKEERDNYKQGLLKWKEKALENEEKLRQATLVTPPSQSYQPVVEPEDYETQKFNELYEKRRAKEITENREKNIRKALKTFVVKHPEYAAENDIDGRNYSRLQEMTSRMFLGNEEGEILDSLEKAHLATRPERKIPTSSPEVEDTGVGDVSLAPKGVTPKPSAMTRPLNQYEQEIANLFPGGEAAYRKKLAEKEKTS